MPKTYSSNAHSRCRPASKTLKGNQNKCSIINITQRRQQQKHTQEAEEEYAEQSLLNAKVHPTKSRLKSLAGCQEKDWLITGHELLTVICHQKHTTEKGKIVSTVERERKKNPRIHSMLPSQQNHNAAPVRHYIPLYHRTIGSILSEAESSNIMGIPSSGCHRIGYGLLVNCGTSWRGGDGGSTSDCTYHLQDEINCRILCELCYTVPAHGTGRVQRAFHPQSGVRFMLPSAYHRNRIHFRWEELKTTLACWYRM